MSILEEAIYGEIRGKCVTDAAARRAAEVAAGVAMEQRGYSPVSDHALLRYLERAKQYDIEAVREEMLTEKVLRAIELSKQLGKCRVRVNGVRLVIKDGVIVTVVPR